MSSSFRVEENAALGRHLVSERDFQIGDMVLEEAPLIYGSTVRVGIPLNDKFPITCVGCLKVVTNSSMECPDCGCPCCSDKCANSEVHKTLECNIFSKLGDESRYVGYACLTYLRIFLLKTTDPEKFRKVLTLSHDFPCLNHESVKELKREVQRFHTLLNVHCGITVTEEEVTRVLKTYWTNGFKMRNFDLLLNSWEGDALYYHASFFANSCSPNCELSYFKRVTETGQLEWWIRFKARKTIKKGDGLTVCYSPSDQILGTVTRGQKIRSVRRFICVCSRCLDPTEDGTNFQAVTCPVCQEGDLLPLHPTQPDSLWQCQDCDSLHNPELVTRCLQILEEQDIQMIQQHGDNSESIRLADNFVETRGGHLLGATNYLVYQCVLHWFRGLRLRSAPGHPADADKKLFTKIMKRVRIYLPITEKLMASNVVGEFQLIVVEVLLYFLFHCKDLKKIQKKRLLVHYKLRIIKRIVGYLSSCLTLLWLKPNSVDFHKDLTHLNGLHGLWSRRLNVLTNDLEEREDLALGALQTLFL